MKKLLSLIPLTFLAGCVSAGRKAGAQAGRGIVDSLTSGDQNYTILNVIAGLASLIAFGSIMARAFGLPIPWKSTTAAIACAVGAWTLRAILVGYMWLFALLIVGAVVFGGVALAYSYRHWIERRLRVDLDRDGKVGKP